MGKVKQINIENPTYYFYNDQINLKDFDERLLKIDKKDYNEINIYYIAYVTINKIADYNNINSVNPFYLMINEMIDHFECNSIEEKNEIKYSVLDDVDENKEVLKNMKKFGRVLKKKLKPLIVVKKLNVGKLLKIRFQSNDDLPLKKPIKLRLLTITIKSIFSENGKFYPQLFLDDTLYELQKCCNIKKLMFQKELI